MKTLINKKNQAPPTILSQSESNFYSRLVLFKFIKLKEIVNKKEVLNGLVF